MNRAIPRLLAVSALLSLAACAKPVAFQPAPEERAIATPSQHGQRASHAQAAPWGIQQSRQPSPFPAAARHHKQAAVPDFSSLHGDARKRRFFRWLQPIVEQENRRIAAQRKRLLRLGGRTMNRGERRLVAALAKEYRLDPGKYSEAHFLRLLLLRVDTVPADLVMAQAAIESAWGTSRFAREGNNLFGEWCYQKGCGLMPKRRNAGASHEVRFFATPALAVRAYLHNINTGKSYRLLRQLRYKERLLHQPLSGFELALGLRNYSERGMAYVRMVRHLIRTHRTLFQQASNQPIR